MYTTMATTIVETSEDKHIQAKANKDKLCETKQNQRYSPVKKKHNLGVRFEPFPLLKFQAAPIFTPLAWS